MINRSEQTYHILNMNIELKNKYYEILELTPEASQHDITVAYRKAKRLYSEQNPALYKMFAPEEALQLQQMIEEAYTILSNDTYRNIYEKRVQANRTDESSVSVDAIKHASQELLDVPVSAALPVIETKSSTYVFDAKIEQEIAEQDTWTGEFLKKVREYKGFSVEDVQTTTKINPWYVTAIEKMDKSNLPVDVFVRGYVVQLAKMYGLKSKEVADSYMVNYKKQY